ncbi:tRNA modification GTPase trmE [Cognatiyoonia koreensis]|uniref:tRNA modification GTPase MnmE n=1 Tax=Cognatiyoonia koreensis TaxID=364200 RepID=A0A1I0RPF8_9RHOB|nr:tRNA uridine-5-carboxymethylaminomethyl(34) synthesis GTPase MnmE [Cognatiyoonia koreensis]SEW43163.1 tRNA modification GTPase trmE [Cognatiyoonia koreensis]
MKETIFALATAPGRAGVSIIRISGHSAEDVAQRLCGTVPAGRGIRRIVNDKDDLIDQALVLYFPGTSSFTGEPVVELHLHGSPAIVAAVLEALGRDASTRLAEAGEFTRRALENGKLDLAQVEGLADLIDAETEAQRRQAIRVFDGELGHLADDWRRALVRAAALIEATIDFADEDIPENVFPEVQELLDKTRIAMEIQISGVQAAERIRDGFEVAIVGAPNTGKSTLLNRIAGRKAAITSAIAGTTRDVIEVRMNLGGLPVTLLDTAGIRETEDIVEGMGIALAKDRARAADLRVFLIEDDQDLIVQKQVDDIVLQSKADLRDNPEDSVSGLTGDGVDDLIKLITSTLQQRAASAGVAMRARHRSAMRSAVDLIERVDGMIQAEAGLDLIADDLRAAIRAVDMIVGRVDVEDLLDEIFASFCIGK